MTLANELIAEWANDGRLKAALEEMASSSLSEMGHPTCSLTCTATLDAGAKTVRISIAMVPEGEMFPEDLT